VDEMNNAVTLILNLFHSKVKMLCCTGIERTTAAAETWDLKGQILRSVRMWSWIVLMQHLWI
jgi:hypothetical protein